jgi:hypothetical protein
MDSLTVLQKLLKESNVAKYYFKMLLYLPLYPCTPYSLVVSRWWEQYTLLPWPDSFGILATGLMKAGTVLKVLTSTRQWDKIIYKP